jgi:hypothetical protein
MTIGEPSLRDSMTKIHDRSFENNHFTWFRCEPLAFRRFPSLLKEVPQGPMHRLGLDLMIVVSRGQRETLLADPGCSSLTLKMDWAPQVICLLMWWSDVPRRATIRLASESRVSGVVSATSDTANGELLTMDREEARQSIYGIRARSRWCYVLKNKRPIYFCLSCLRSPMNFVASDEPNHEEAHLEVSRSSSKLFKWTTVTNSLSCPNLRVWSVTWTHEVIFGLEYSITTVKGNMETLHKSQTSRIFHFNYKIVI